MPGQPNARSLKPLTVAVPEQIVSAGYATVRPLPGAVDGMVVGEAVAGVVVGVDVGEPEGPVVGAPVLGEPVLGEPVLEVVGEAVPGDVVAGVVVGDVVPVVTGVCVDVVVGPPGRNGGRPAAGFASLAQPDNRLANSKTEMASRYGTLITGATFRLNGKYLTLPVKRR